MRDHVGNPAGLGQAVLAEVPGQLLKFMQTRNIKPNKPTR